MYQCSPLSLALLLLVQYANICFAVDPPYLRLVEDTSVDGLGWCMDIFGFGGPNINSPLPFEYEKVTVHSCKPDAIREQAVDHLFAWDQQTGLIESKFPVLLERRCVGAVNLGPGADVGAVICDESDPTQQFVHDPCDGGTIRVKHDRSLCLVYDGEPYVAGPYFAGDVILDECATTPAAHKHWVVVPASGVPLACEPTPLITKSRLRSLTINVNNYKCAQDHPCTN
eukprot:TRINITY_DN49340_c0_g1_i1.p1 TRINITY_DN49340_c0_g1~~TRINITY_DN49340_c0_g1_i1.p1  ORF type:complete len:227 (+),score=0.15 TRINITY_DN49340_c0_g1_i1:24-704(+)